MFGSELGGSWPVAHQEKDVTFLAISAKGTPALGRRKNGGESASPICPKSTEGSRSLELRQGGQDLSSV